MHALGVDQHQGAGGDHPGADLERLEHVACGAHVNDRSRTQHLLGSRLEIRLAVIVAQPSGDGRVVSQEVAGPANGSGRRLVTGEHQRQQLVAELFVREGRDVAVVSVACSDQQRKRVRSLIERGVVSCLGDVARKKLTHAVQRSIDPRVPPRPSGEDLGQEQREIVGGRLQRLELMPESGPEPGVVNPQYQLEDQVECDGARPIGRRHDLARAPPVDLRSE